MRHPWAFTRRIAMGFIAALVLAAAIAATTMLALRSVSAGDTQHLVARASYVLEVERMRGAFGEKVSAQRGYLFTGNPLFLVDAELARQQFLESLRELEALPLGWREARLLEQVERTEQAHQEAVERLLALRDEGVEPERLESFLMLQVSPARERAERLLDQLYWQGEQSLRGGAWESMAEDRRALWLILVAALLGLLLAGALVWVLTRELRPLHHEARASEERFRLLVEGVKDYALYLLDPRGRVVSWNPGAERITGWRAGEVVGSPDSLFYPKEEVEQGKPEENRERALCEGRLETQGWRVRRDGTRFWAETLLTPLRDEYGRLEGHAVLTRDISERRRAEQTQRLFIEAERLFHAWQEPDRAVVELVRMAVPELADGCILSLLSPTGELRTQVVLDTFPEKERLFQELIAYREELPERQRDVLDVIASGRSSWISTMTREKWEALPNARERELIEQIGAFSFLVVPLRVGERGLGVMSLISHQAEHRFTRTDQVFIEELASRAALALENARLLREAQAALELIGVAAHDLGSPLNALQLHLQRLRRKPPESPEKLREGLGSALMQTERLGRLLHNLLDLSRLSSGKLELEVGEVDLSELTHELVARHAEQVEVSGSRLELDVELGVVGRWDRQRLERVLTNLLSNALKYGKGQPVEVRVSRVGELARLEVRDHGPGIPLEEQRHVFERFKRVSSAGEKAGFGLGLYIVRQLVEAHGGTIRVESVPGQGAAFIVELPLLSESRVVSPAGSQVPELLH